MSAKQKKFVIVGGLIIIVAAIVAILSRQSTAAVVASADDQTPPDLSSSPQYPMASGSSQPIEVGGSPNYLTYNFGPSHDAAKVENSPIVGLGAPSDGGCGGCCSDCSNSKCSGPGQGGMSSLLGVITPSLMDAQVENLQSALPQGVQNWRGISY